MYVIATAAQLNNAATHVADSKSAQAAFSRKVLSLRRQSSGLATVQENLDALASMSELVADEDCKARQ